MKKNKKISIAAWVICFILSNVLLFCLAEKMTAAVWVTAVFVWIAFASSLIFQQLAWKNAKDLDEQFLRIPSLVISLGYLIVQLPVCIVFALGAQTISCRAAVLVNGILLAAAWLAALGSLFGNDHIQSVNSRQKDHHTEL